MYRNRVYATNFNRIHIWRKIINESLSVTIVDLSGIVTMKMVKLTILDLSCSSMVKLPFLCIHLLL